MCKHEPRTQPRFGIYLQVLLFMWFVVEDHDILFILSETFHLVGLAILVWKLQTKKSAAGARVTYPCLPRLCVYAPAHSALRCESRTSDMCLHMRSSHPIMFVWTRVHVSSTGCHPFSNCQPLLLRAPGHLRAWPRGGCRSSQSRLILRACRQRLTIAV